MDISPSNFGHILSIRERPSGQHPITLATLDLLATLVKGLSSPVDDDCLGECPVDLAASVLFVVHDIFSSFHRWRYVDIKDRDILGMKVQGCTMSHLLVNDYMEHFPMRVFA